MPKREREREIENERRERKKRKYFGKAKREGYKKERERSPNGHKRNGGKGE